MTEATVALDSAYTYGSAGDANFWSLIPAEDGNLTDFWIKISAYAGTWASTDGVINVEVREGLNGSSKPGTTLVDSFTITLDGTTTGWIKKTGLSIALLAGRSYAFVVADADGGATNYCTLVRHYINHVTRLGVGPTSCITTNGYSTAGTNTGAMGAMVAKIGGILYGGSGFSTTATLSNNTNERGFRFRLPHPALLTGVYFLTDPTNANGYPYKLYADADAPGATPLWSYDGPTTALGGATSPIGFGHGFPEASHYYLDANVWYRFIVAPTANTTVPRKATVGGNPDSDVLAAMIPISGEMYFTLQSGSSWSDNTAEISYIYPVLYPIDTPSGGGVEPSSIFIG